MGKVAALTSIGVTGGIGRGKSLVCAMLSKLGIPVFSADEMAKHILHTDQSLRRKLTSLLGPEAYSSNGILNTAYVASRIFSDASLQQSVNRIVRPRVEATLDRADALRGADAVLTTILAGSTEVWRHDLEIPKKYGVDTNVGDTRGPSGIFRFLRTINPMMDIVRDMERYCPKAVLLNYTNPMAMLVLVLILVLLLLLAELLQLHTKGCTSLRHQMD